jgi:cell division protein DivIC
MASFSDIGKKLQTFWGNLMKIGFFRVVLNKYFLVGAVFVVWILFFDRNSVVRWVRTVRNVNELQKQKSSYEEGIQSSDEKLKELKSNKDSLEKFAREQYYFHKDGEDVYVFKGMNDK